MNPYMLIAIVLTLVAAIAVLNHRFLNIQTTIAIMAGSMLISFILLLGEHVGMTDFTRHTQKLLIQTNFHHLLINGMLSFLLFAGSLTLDVERFKNKLWEIGTLATVSTILSTLLIGSVLYYLFILLGLQLPYLFCLLFGALISPTDPIAVLATFKEIHAPKNLETCVAGESLFNDGVGIVIFLTLYQLTFQDVPITFSEVTFLFVTQAIGGVLYGALLGFVTNKLIHLCRDAKIAVLITLAIVTGGYQLALSAHISGPLAMVVAGMFVANTTKKEKYMTLHLFWEVVDEVLNAVLFLLIGFELLVVHATWTAVVATLCVIPLVLLIRLLTVALPITFLQRKRASEPYAITILTWGGLRGGLAVALALSLPPSSYRELILTLTYGVVAFAIIVQGLTIKPLAKWVKSKGECVVSR